jgi:phospho-N-acetylmuramoyl-pentapeptide-transferase
MGGIVFISSSIVSILFATRLSNPYVIGALLVLVLFCYIGARDDIAKITSNSNSEGLSPKQKLLYQVIASFIAVEALVMAGHSTAFFVPFIKHPLFNMGVFALFFWILVIVSSSNAVNLTDGLDGLATVPSIFALMSLSIIVYIGGHAILSNYLLVPKIMLGGELTVVGASIIGSLIAFLWYNSHPAQIFMGDSGSLALGGIIGYLAIVAKSEVLLILIGLIFVIETVSVILQVGSYKYRKKRVFLMAPIHHHFEQKGWAENKIIVRFWIIALMSNLFALLTLKIR